MWLVASLRQEILDLFREAQAPVFERVRAQYTKFCPNERGTCAICGAAFEIPPHATGLKLYCGSRCSMRQRNIRRRGAPKNPRWFAGQQAET